MMKNRGLKKYFSCLFVGLFLVISCSNDDPDEITLRPSSSLAGQTSDNTGNETTLPLTSDSEGQASDNTDNETTLPLTSDSEGQTSDNTGNETTLPLTSDSEGQTSDNIALSSQIKDYVNNDVLDIVYSNESTFAALKNDGTVITSGYQLSGGDPSYEDFGVSKASEKLVNVKKIVSTQGAFAALTNDGKVITWGNNLSGGNTELIKDQLTDVQDIVSTFAAFAALTNDGKVITWGSDKAGGNSDSVGFVLNSEEAFKSKVTKIISAKKGAFAALRDKKVITWGQPIYGGDPSFSSETLHVRGVVDVNINMVDVKDIFSTDDAFVALTYDGRLLGWGQESSLEGMPFNAAGITKIVSTQGAFAALFNADKKDNTSDKQTVITWGNKFYGGNPDFEDNDNVKANEELIGIVGIYSTDRSFIAVSSSIVTDSQGYAHENKKLISWGNKNYCKINPSLADVDGKSFIVKNIFSNRLGFVVEQYDTETKYSTPTVYGPDNFKDFVENALDKHENN